MTDWNNVIFWDIEVFPNWSFFSWFNNNDRDTIHFVDLMDYDEIKKFLEIDKYKFAWNAYKYDNRMLDGIVRLHRMKECSYNDIYCLSQEIIKDHSEVESYDVAEDFKYKDLPRMLEEFYNKQKKMVTGLKIVAGQYDLEVMVSPHNFDKEVKEEDKEGIIKYCQNDIKIMAAIWDNNQDLIDSKIYLCDEYGLKHPYRTNANMAKEIFKPFLIETNDPIIEDESPFDHIKWSDTVLFDDVTIKESFLKAKGEKETLYIADHPITISSGGLHSKLSEPIVAHDVLDVDVASYYPHIILTLGVVPKQMSEEFLPFLREITETRIEAKKNGEKVKANALKIVINSLFGMMGETYANGSSGKFHDKSAFLSVTQNGQLGLLDLIEKLSKHSEIMFANTDGVTIKVKNIGGVKRAISAWERRNNFNLESVKYKHLYLRDITNYMAVTEDNKIKSKGSYGGAGSRIPLINKAVEEFAKIGICRENEKHIYDYMIKQDSKQFKKILSYVDDHGVKQKDAFYYVTNDYVNLMNVNEEGKRISVAGGDRVSLLPSGLDYDRYFGMILELVSIFYNNQEFVDKYPNLPIVNMTIKYDSKNHKYNCKCNVTGIKPTQPETWTHSVHAEGYGAICHPKTSIICFDIDEPENLTADQSKIFQELRDDNNFTITSSHPSKYSMLFEVKPEQMNCANRKLKDGFEVLYGKFKKIYGRHSMNGVDLYNVSGEIKVLPDVLYKLFKKKKTKVESKAVPTSKDLKQALSDFGFTNIKEETDKIICTHQEYIDDYSSTHSGEEPSDIAVYPNEDIVVFSSFHATSKDIILDLQKRFNEYYKKKETKKTVVTSSDIPTLPTDSDMLKFCIDGNGILSFGAPTGGGKTYTIAEHSKRRSAVGKSTIVSMPTKQAIYEFNNLLIDLGIDEEKIKILHAGTSKDFQCDDGDIVVVIHHYLCRKSMTKFLYSTLMKLHALQDVVLYIDEFHTFANTIKTQLSFNTTYTKLGAPGRLRYGSNSSKSIKSLSESEKRIPIDIATSYHTGFTVTGSAIIEEGIQVKCVDLLNKRCVGAVDKYYDNYGLKVSILEDSSSVNSVRDDLASFVSLLDQGILEDTDNYEDVFRDIVDDILSWSRLPMVHQHYIQIKEQIDESSSECAFRLFGYEDVETALSIMNGNPNMSEHCAYEDVYKRTFIGTDFLPIRHLQMLNKELGWKIILTTATPTITTNEIYKYLGVNTIWFENKYQDNILDVLNVISVNYQEVFTKNNITPKSDTIVLNYNDMFSRAVVFLSTKSAFEREYSNKKNSVDRFAFYSDSVVQTTMLGCDNNENKVLVTYARSSLGTGYNLFNRNVCIINQKFLVNPQGIPQPLFKQDLNINDMVMIESDAQTIQNIGRITRTKTMKKKTIVLNNALINTDFLKIHAKEVKFFNIYYDLDITTQNNYETHAIITDIMEEKVGKEVVFSVSTSTRNQEFISKLLLVQEPYVLKGVFKTDKAIEEFKKWKSEGYNGYTLFPADLNNKHWVYILYLMNHTTIDAKRIMSSNTKTQKSYQTFLDSIMSSESQLLHNVSILRCNGLSLEEIAVRLNIKIDTLCDTGWGI
jgi:hypothetical protein